MVIGKLQEWKEKFPETDFELLQHIAGPLNPAYLQTRLSCSAPEVKINTPWQNGPDFLKLPREEWLVKRDFKNKIPEEEVVQTIKAPKIKLNLLRLVPTCSCRVCSWLKDPCQCSDCKKTLNPRESSCFQSFHHILIRTNSIERARGIIARVLRTSKTIKDQLLERPGRYKDYS